MASLRCVQAARSKRSIRLNFMVMLFFGVLHYPTLLPRNATWHAPALIQCQLCQKKTCVEIRRFVGNPWRKSVPSELSIVLQEVLQVDDAPVIDGVVPVGASIAPRDTDIPYLHAKVRP